MNATVPTGTTASALFACVRREIRMRERVYPGWVARHRMTEAASRAEIETMRAVLLVLEQVLPPEAETLPPQGSLFGEAPAPPKTDPFALRRCSDQRLDGAHAFRWSTRACGACSLRLEDVRIAFAIFVAGDGPTAEEWTRYVGIPEARASELAL